MAQVAHSEPNPVYHRDIRPQNIVKKSNEDDWFLIDWTDAETPGMRSPHNVQFDPTNHDPRVCDPGHGGEVDIWGVGYCLIRLAASRRVTCPDEVREIGRNWQGSTPTAVEALAQIKVLNFNRLSCLILMF